MKPTFLKRSALTSLAIAATVLVGLAVAENTDKALLERARGLFKALPDTAHVDDYPHSSERVELGKKLFFETRVSTDGRMSCAACHNPSYYGADSLALSVGVHGTLLPRNAPTVFNTPLLIAQHYGGNRVSVEEQAMKALLSPIAYGNKTYGEAEEKMRSLGYTPLFEKAFPNEKESVSAENWATAIGAKVVSTSLAIIFNWLGNRSWTFRHERHTHIVREFVEFVAASLLGMGVSLACLWFTHYVLNLTSLLADNISGNIIGLGLGTIVRFVLYRYWVWSPRRAAAAA
jgi:putative flippase GtrA